MNAPQITARLAPAPYPGAALGWRGAGIAAQIRVLTASSLKRLVCDRQLLVVSLLEPLLTLVVFSQLFAGMVHIPGFPAGERYIDFLLPALLVITAIQTGLQAGTGLLDDMRDGLMPRLRSLPIWLGSVLIARSLTGAVQSVLRLATLLVPAFVVIGYRPAGGPVGMGAVLVLALVLGWSLGWVFLALACWLDRAEMLQAGAGIVMFPLMFASSALVPEQGMPGWLRAAARFNPLSHGIEAARDLAHGRPAGAGVLIAIAIGLAVAAAAMPVAVRGIQRPR
ncbi:ABC transporter permease [Spirillospora sp. NPDC050679]